MASPPVLNFDILDPRIELVSSSESSMSGPNNASIGELDEMVPVFQGNQVASNFKSNISSFKQKIRQRKKMSAINFKSEMRDNSGLRIL